MRLGVRVFRCWSPHQDQVRVVQAETTAEAAKEFLGVESVQWLSGASPAKGVVYIAWADRRVCQVKEVTQ